ncbi:MAG: hypothetical protein ABIS21_04000 [Acidimicrobiales bacterium]
MEPKIQFFFYLGAVICFALSAAGEAWKFGARSRRGMAPALALLPLGLALFAFPTMWTLGTDAF